MTFWACPTCGKELEPPRLCSEHGKVLPVEMVRLASGAERLTEQNDPRYADTFYLVEATDYEALECWKQWHERIEWRQESHGWLAFCGDLAGFGPVTCTVSWNIIGGKRVLFYDAASRYVDHDMVRDYLTARCPSAQHTNAMNFHNCVHAIERAPDRGRGAAEGEE